MSEKVLLLNDPYPEEYNIAVEYGFKVVQPNDIPDAKVKEGLSLCDLLILWLTHTGVRFIIYINT